MMTKTSLYLDRITGADPQADALCDAAGTLSYADLNDRANGVARNLMRRGVKRGSTVAICMDRSFEQIVAALATMRAGAAYVPIDPVWPKERIEYILADCGASVLIAPATRSCHFSCDALCYDPAFAEMDEDAPEDAVTMPDYRRDDLAYIIYTSGSTGVPKGVELTHANLDHLIGWHLQAFGVTGSDRASHLAGLGFDAAVWEIWPYLSVGASISLVDRATRMDPALLQEWLVKQGITIAFVPTPVAEPLMVADWPRETRLRTLLVGGDTLHVAPKAGLPFVCVNNYGPSECSVVATSGIVDPETSGLPSIGRAIRGTTIYVLDEQRKRVDAGVRGEIFVGGAGVGRGYRNRPEQTMAAFLADPFTTVPGGRMYKTGDLGSMMSDGQVCFLGRSDTQVKIRGNRIELEEIVCVLNRHLDVGSSVVIASDGDETEKHLIAYIVPVEGALLTVRDLRDYAALSLPPYMIPARFVQLASLALSANGKIDRGALPAPSADNSLPEDAGRAACTETEETLLTLVKKILGTDQVQVDDDFFMVGGHSLLGTQLVLRAREAFGVMLSIRDLFEAATVARLAARIEFLIVEQIADLSDEEALRLVTGHES